MENKQKHSLADWDFYNPALCVLSSEHYVSPPTSLELCWASGYARRIGLSRKDNAQLVTNGRIISSVWLTRMNVNQPFIFRNQSALGSAGSTNSYYINIDVSNWKLYVRIAGAVTFIGQSDGEFEKDCWMRLRLTWKNAITGQGNANLDVTLDREVDGEWVQQGDPIHDPLNRWQDSEINRCGLMCDVYTAYHNWIDDTEIWKLV